MAAAEDLPCPWKQLRRLPEGWTLYVGVDTGTYMSSVFTAIPPGDEPQVIVLAEFPNYRYVAHEIELLDISIPEWARWVVRGFHHFLPSVTRCKAWADPNNQFSNELRRYGIDLRGNNRKLELRTEITREYMGQVIKHGPKAGQQRALLAPYLEVLPYEMEHAKWPDGTTGAGKFARIKESDHTLDCFEHCCSRRPRSKRIFQSGKKSFLQQQLEEHKHRHIVKGDPHLGEL